jgi:hypothetical protein
VKQKAKALSMQHSVQVKCHSLIDRVVLQFSSFRFDLDKHCFHTFALTSGATETAVMVGPCVTSSREVGTIADGVIFVANTSFFCRPRVACTCCTHGPGCTSSMSSGMGISCLTSRNVGKLKNSFHSSLWAVLINDQAASWSVHRFPCLRGIWPRSRL